MVFTEQIKLALERSGLPGLSSHKINDYVVKLYGNLERPPVYQKYTIDGKRSHGFNRIMLCEVVAFDRHQEQRNLRQSELETIRQNARFDSWQQRDRQVADHQSDGMLGKRSYNECDRD
jgi:hypothetical protein